MTRIGFYHLTRSTLEQALPRLLEKALGQGMRAVVRVAGEERLDLLDRALWTYGRDSFLPHGTARDGFAEKQPIWLTTGLDTPNGASLLVLVDGASAEGMEAFERAIEIFDGHDPAAVARARERWRWALKAGHEREYWQQDERGGWRQGGSRSG